MENREKNEYRVHVDFSSALERDTKSRAALTGREQDYLMEFLLLQTTQKCRLKEAH